MTPSLDRELVLQRLGQLDEDLRVLEDLRSVRFAEFARDPRCYWAAEHGLQLCIQAVLDIAAHVVSGLAFPAPNDYRELILTLGERGVLPAEFARRIASMAGFRNILVHEYLRVDLREVYRVLQERLDDFREFARHIAALL